jgi:alkyl hydroperoxide reductase subunit F
MYDLVIIGGGPAGTAGAVYAARKQLKTALVVAEFGGQSTVSEDIRNWIGTPSISGSDLAHSFKAHIDSYVGDFLTVYSGEYATDITRNGPTDFTVTTTHNSLQTKSILIATGSTRRRLDIPGANVFEHKGLTYCASCDGPLFSGQDVAVIGGGNAGFESVAQLLAYCKSVTLVHRSEKFRADEITVSTVLAHNNVTALKNTEPIEVKGDTFVNGLVVKDKLTGEIRELPVSGIFVEIGLIPSTSFAEGIVNMNEIKQIIVDPRTQQTSVPGIWAAGDCTDGLYHQNNIAAGDAVKALEDLYQWIRRQ